MRQKIPFKPFPIVFVFPSVFLVVFKLFATGLIKNSTSLLVTAECNAACKGLASFTLALGLGFVGFGWVVLTDFNLRWAKAQWKPAGKPPTAIQVDDPFYRGISLLRAKLLGFGSSDPRSIMNRSQGKFGKVPAQTKGARCWRRARALPYLPASYHPLHMLSFS